MSSNIPAPDPQAPQPGIPYTPPQYSPTSAPAGPQRNMLVFVVSILLIIGGALSIISGFGLFGLISLVNAAGGYYAGPSVGLIVITGIIAIVAGAYELIVGIIGVRNADKPAQGGLLFTLGIGLCVITLISMILTIAAGGNAFSGILGFVLPVLFLIGAMNLRKQAA